ncbi:MAG: sigma-54 interaction domain-containing protein [Aeoliella sp.]
MRDVYRLTRQAARSKASVLLLGETGTGKELVAEALHELSERSNRPFVKVNCGALSDTLLESELFGHMKGAFTGAIADRAGRFQSADTGTIFLDEINSTTPLLQVKLLRVLQEQAFERVGGDTTIRVDTRIISASNCNLLEMASEGRFREDLYYRLNVVPIYLPPLRARREDIPELVSHFLHVYNEQNDRYVAHIDTSALQALQDYHWPGNVRELQNVVEHAVVMATGDEMTPDLLPGVVHGECEAPELGGPGQFGTGQLDFESLAEQYVVEGLQKADEKADDLHSRIVDRVEREVIAQVLTECEGVKIKAASRLGIKRNTLHKKIKDYGLGE